MKVSEIPAHGAYESFSETWQLKARRLQARRWRKLKQQLV